MAKEEKKVKYYNPYPFPVRVVNDLGKEHVFAPQEHGKVFKNRYTQSKLELPLRDKKAERVYRTDLDLDLDKMLKSDLIDLAWALLMADKVELEGMTKREITKAIRDKVGLEDVPEDDTTRENIPGNPERAENDAEEQEDSEEKSEELEIDEASGEDGYKGIVNTETHGD